jgi:hypothetical protein
VREGDGELTMSKQTQQKFLVVSYDDDQQQWFWDYVAATTGEAAAALVCKRRPYVIAADAASLPQARVIVRDLERRSTPQITEQFHWDTSSRRKQ